MAQRNARAVHIETLVVTLVKAKAVGTGQHLGGEGFVQFEQVQVLERESGALQHQLGGGYRADAHALGVHPGHRPAHQTAQGLEAQSGRLLGRGDDAGGSAVVLPAGIAGGHGGFSVELEAYRRERAQALHGGLGPGMLVDRNLLRAFAALDGDRHDFVGEAARLLGGHRVLV